MCNIEQKINTLILKFTCIFLDVKFVKYLAVQEIFESTMETEIFSQ